MAIRNANETEIENDDAYIIIDSRTYGRHRVQVDRSDLDELLKYRWFLQLNKNRRIDCPYDVVTGSIKGKTVLMSRFLMNAEKGMVVDHIDRNSLNNQRSNLRLVTPQENAFNTNAKGYWWNKRSNKWQAGIRINYKPIHLGYFNTEAEASAAYQEAKLRYHKL
jgi:hypothetical protein